MSTLSYQANDMCWYFSVEKRVLFQNEPRPEIIDGKQALVSTDIVLPDIDRRFIDEDDLDSPYQKMQLVYIHIQLYQIYIGVYVNRYIAFNF